MSSDVDWIRGFMAGVITMVFIILMLALIVVTWARKAEKKDPADWWRRGEEPPEYK